MALSRKLISLLLCFCIAAVLFAVPSSSSDAMEIVDSSLTDAKNKYYFTQQFGLEYSLSTGKESVFDYTVPDGGVTLIFFFDSSGNSGNSNNFFTELADASWAKNDKINLVAVDSKQNSRDTVQKYINKYDKEKVIDTVWYSPTNIYLPYWYLALINANGGPVSSFEGSYAPVFVLVVTKDGKDKLIRYSVSSQASVKYLQNYINEFVDSGEQSVPVVEVTPLGTLHFDMISTTIRLTNEARAKNGLPELTTNPEINSLAMMRAIETSILYKHSRPDGTSNVSVTVDGVKYEGNILLENISAGYGTVGTILPEETVAAWLKSESHIKNIMSTDVNQIGVGVFETNGVIYWVQLFGKGTRVAAQTMTSPLENVCMPVRVFSNLLNPYFDRNALKSFLTTITAGQDTTVSLPPFYSVNADSKAEILPATMFLPILTSSDGSVELNMTKSVDSTGFTVVTDLYLSATKAGSCTISITPYVGSDVKLETSMTVNPGETTPPDDDPPEDQYKLGDVNRDGKINARDVTMLMKGVVAQASASDYPLGDMNKDGKLNARDVTALMKKILGG